MPRISQAKKEKISEQILNYLFSISPEAVFTNKIAQETARDEEFTKALLLELKAKNLIIEINKNQKGVTYIRRQRWLLSDQVFNVFKQRSEQRSQPSSQSQQSLY
jgi:hypothetical protein